MGQDGEREYSDAQKWMVIKGRKWRRTDPELPEEMVAELKSHLGTARNAVRTAQKTGTDEEVSAARNRVSIAKHGLGERGDYWWQMDVGQRIARAEESLDRLR
ncbi:biopolymer transporter Tol [Brevibacterium aurantiacum]|uniref:Biopolymer transporter Tol n=1 Tax=Brevibacterium aurantiacum TaxID=273384 RepID=A0A556CD01_BREAU|nr:biopolymer transporter Tol [Brevibacterium aurantiacum]TSI14928.1 biopolymer transporter Tol [Brevibacterium aurantiacum]